jgi:hypothetical protein
MKQVSRHFIKLIASSIVLLGIASFAYSAAAGIVSGELKKWHTVTITFDGPTASESDTTTFLNNRLNVTFTTGSETITVPGFFAADGNAAISGATSGTKWRVHFCPDVVGTWTYTASFRTGSNVAVDPSATAGAADATIDGATGTFTVAASDKTAPDFRARGMLRYVNKHYLQFAETGECFIKGGSNSPDNIFAFGDFDNTPASHAFAAHVADWTSQDSTWGGKGKGLLGALNYLSSKGLNSQSIRVFNRPAADTTGKGDVYPYLDSGSAPWTAATPLKTFDCSKLDQWEIAFEHMTKRGLLINVVLSQPGNASYFEAAEGLLTNANPFAVTRKLFYREMVARFAHHCAVTWNIVEATNDLNMSTGDQTQSPSVQQMIGFAAYLRSMDPYGHLIEVGTQQFVPEPSYFIPLEGADTGAIIGGIEVIDDNHSAYEYPNYYWNQNQRTARPYICFQDQVYGGVPYYADTLVADSVAAQLGIDVLWPHLLQGGSGMEFNSENQGRQLEDLRKFDRLWTQVAIAQRFMAGQPLQFMYPGSGQLTSHQVRYPYMQIGNDSLFIVKINSNFDKFFDMSDTTKFKAGDKFAILWFIPKTGLYAKGTVDTIEVSDIAQEAQRTSFGVPPGVAADTLWTQGSTYPYSVQWICIVRNSKYSVGVANTVIPNRKSSMLRVAGSRVYFTAATKDRVTIMLTSPNGARVKTIFNGVAGSGTHLVSLDPSRLATGVYFVTMRQGAMQYVERFVKIK